jgi:hypothetical protein
MHVEIALSLLTSAEVMLKWDLLLWRWRCHASELLRSWAFTLTHPVTPSTMSSCSRKALIRCLQHALGLSQTAELQGINLCSLQITLPQVFCYSNRKQTETDSRKWPLFKK